MHQAGAEGQTNIYIHQVAEKQKKCPCFSDVWEIVHTRTQHEYDVILTWPLIFLSLTSSLFLQTVKWHQR